MGSVDFFLRSPKPAHCAMPDIQDLAWQDACFLGFGIKFPDPFMSPSAVETGGRFPTSGFLLSVPYMRHFIAQ